MAKHEDRDGDGIADQGELPIGSLHNETIYESTDEDQDPDAHEMMHQGKPELGEDNDLRDPWFHTDEGRAWLAERGEA